MNKNAVSAAVAGAFDQVLTEHRSGTGQKILVTVRASSWGDFADCQLRWYYKNIEGLRFPSNGRTVIGSATHRGTGLFDQSALEGTPAPVEAAVQAAVDYIVNPVDPDGQPQEVAYDDDMTKGDALDMSVKLTAKYCREFAPTVKYAGVEMRCNALDVNTAEGIVRMTGTTDRLMETQLRDWGIADMKTGKMAVGADGIAVTKGHGLQLGAYTLMTQQETGKKLGAATIIGMQTNSKLRIGVGVVKDPTLALVGTNMRPGVIEIFADTVKRGVFAPNPKSNLCSEKWCPAYSRCLYHD